MHDRFRHDLIALLGHAPNRALALAVSGGPDSMAMLALAVAAFPGQVIAATVDHRLRAESADEAAMVARHCAAIGVAHAILTPPHDWQPRTVQADARQLRYALLGAWAVGARAAALLTAHHADDSAETFLMRAARGSGVAGLSGIRPRWEWQPERWDATAPRGKALPVLRPLLKWRRSALAEVVAATATPFVTDPSNTDDRFDRVRIREMLARTPDIDATALAQAAAACAEADAALAAMTELLHRERLRDGAPDSRTYHVANLPRELCRRLARAAIRHVRSAQPVTEGRWSNAGNVESLLDALESGGKATVAGVVASARGDIWTFSPAPPRRSH